MDLNLDLAARASVFVFHEINMKTSQSYFAEINSAASCRHVKGKKHVDKKTLRTYHSKSTWEIKDSEFIKRNEMKQSMYRSYLEAVYTARTFRRRI